jgi:hypothetical protein
MEHKSLRQMAREFGISHTYLYYIISSVKLPAIDMTSKGKIYDEIKVKEAVEAWYKRPHMRCIQLKYLAAKHRLRLADVYKICKDNDITMYSLRREGLPNCPVILLEDAERLKALLKGATA